MVIRQDARVAETRNLFKARPTEAIRAAWVSVPVTETRLLLWDFDGTLAYRDG